MKATELMLLAVHTVQDHFLCTVCKAITALEQDCLATFSKDVI